MNTPTTRSKLILPLVALGSYVLGGASVVGCITAHKGADPSDTTRAQVKADISSIHMALDAFAHNNGGNYPDKLDKLVLMDMNGHRYLNHERIPRDPWGREYVYVDATPPRVLTYGRDGAPGGTGDDADIDAVAILNGR